MAELQELSRNLHASGYNERSEGGITYLYSNGGTLVSKQWNGSSFGDEELVNSGVKTNSQSAFLGTPEERVVVSISSANTLVVNKFNEDDEEWVEDDCLPTPVVHRDSKLAAYVDTNGGKHVFYQDPAGNLVHLQGSERSDTIPGNAVPGTPLAVVIEENPHLFYVSSQDNFIHHVDQKDGAWTDTVLIPFEVKRRLARLELAPDVANKTLIVYCLADDGTLFQISTENGGKETILGKVETGGSFKAATSAECCPRIVPRCRPYPRPRISGGASASVPHPRISGGASASVPHPRISGGVSASVWSSRDWYC
ncbi:hypothetical protein FRC18_005267 [Serendipita sp. 400]|nr:hypothetical protein FRC18_005267 [Serendipita sp. 400]